MFEWQFLQDKQLSWRQLSPDSFPQEIPTRTISSLTLPPRQYLRIIVPRKFPPGQFSPGFLSSVPLPLNNLPWTTNSRITARREISPGQLSLGQLPLNSFEFSHFESELHLGKSSTPTGDPEGAL